MTLKVLILGGTSEGRCLAEQLASDTRYQALLSFAGRTASLERPSTPHRIGGFGGVEGLTAFLDAHGFAALIDATHAFAAQMSRHAVKAAARTGTPLLRIECPAWQRVTSDRWHEVPDMAAAAQALGTAPRRVLLTIGRLEVATFAAAPQHDYLIRAVDDFQPDLPRARVLRQRGPFAVADERALFVREAVEVLVSKNAGTPATYAKIEVARALAVPVIMVARPTPPAALTVTTLAEAVAWLEGLHGASAIRRGV